MDAARHPAPKRALPAPRHDGGRRRRRRADRGLSPGRLPVWPRAGQRGRALARLNRRHEPPPCTTPSRDAPSPRSYVADMDFALSARAEEVTGRLWDFMRGQVFPAEPVYDEWRGARGPDKHQHPPRLGGLEGGAPQRGLRDPFPPRRAGPPPPPAPPAAGGHGGG